VAFGVLLARVPRLFYRGCNRGFAIMDAKREREIIRLWNMLRLLQREGRPTAAVRKQIERALAEQDEAA